MLESTFQSTIRACCAARSSSRSVHRSITLISPEVISFDFAPDNDIYRNIQVANRNMLSAAMAVKKWNKLRGFCTDDMREHHSLYTIATHGLTKEDKA
jgi:hypothetical protein